MILRLYNEIPTNYTFSPMMERVMMLKAFSKKRGTHSSTLVEEHADDYCLLYGTLPVVPLRRKDYYNNS